MRGWGGRGGELKFTWQREGVERNESKAKNKWSEQTERWMCQAAAGFVVYNTSTGKYFMWAEQFAGCHWVNFFLCPRWKEIHVDKCLDVWGGLTQRVRLGRIRQRSTVYCLRPRVSPVPETKENENKCLTFVAATLPKWILFNLLSWKCRGERQ